jgi:SAM-dependent methyltransferase
VTLVGAVHGGLVHPRRVQVLAAHAARLVPQGADVLDVGSGDGRVAAALAALRPDVRVRGLDVLVRDDAAIEVRPFDGRAIPYPDRSVDVVTLFDVLHHADEPADLLGEAARVARSCIVLKDHVCDGMAARLALTFMDRVGNRRHGVTLPYHYWSSRQWDTAIAGLRLGRGAWEVGGLGLYPWPASVVFGGSMHVLACLSVPHSQRTH